MTFYEELGVPPDAPLDTIREAYRNVARLLHPDAQTNPALKESAEAQMKRINQLYDILSDPERRRRYDQELAEPPDHPSTIVIQAPPAAGQSLLRRGGNGVWLGATAVCAASIIWLAAREPTATPTVYPLPVPRTQEATAAVHPKHNPEKRREDEIARLRAELIAANADRERLMKQVAALEAERANPANLIPAVTPMPSLEIPLPPVAQSLPKAVPAKGWSGSWTYRRSRAGNTSQTLSPPEFIEAVIKDDNGWVHGQYHARFKVADPTISPEVSFYFEGRISGKDGRLIWTGNEGATGEVHLKLISDNALELNWSASSLGSSMGLASGTSVLDRKN